MKKIKHITELTIGCILFFLVSCDYSQIDGLNEEIVEKGGNPPAFVTTNEVHCANGQHIYYFASNVYSAHITDPPNGEVMEAKGSESFCSPTTNSFTQYLSFNSSESYVVFNEQDVPLNLRADLYHLDIPSQVAGYSFTSCFESTPYDPHAVSCL